MRSPSNIIFLHTYDAISAYGNGWVNTPNIDRLHRNSVSFTRAYCTDPVCAPAQTRWITGRYSSETGVPFNGRFLHADIRDGGQQLNRITMILNGQRSLSAYTALRLTRYFGTTPRQSAA